MYIVCRITVPPKPNSTTISYQECQSLYNALIIATELYLMTGKLVSSIVYSIPCSFQLCSMNFLLMKFKRALCPNELRSSSDCDVMFCEMQQQQLPIDVADFWLQLRVAFFDLQTKSLSGATRRMRNVRVPAV